MAREAEIPLAECPNARLPFPTAIAQGKGRTPKEVPEGGPNDNWFDDTFWLRTDAEEIEGANQLPPRETSEDEKPKVVKRVSPRRKPA